MLASTFMLLARRLGYEFRRTKSFLFNGAAEWNVYKAGDEKGIICKSTFFGDVFYSSPCSFDSALVDLASRGSAFRAICSRY